MPTSLAPPPSPEQQRVSCALSNFLSERRQDIISDWISNVRRDQKVPAADELTSIQLKDHVPQILDELNQTLDDAFSREIQERAAWHAATHGHLRWHQQYDIAQLIRETSALRMVLICRLAEFQDKHCPNYSGETGLFAMVVVHSFFDRIIRISVEQFVATSQLIKHPSPPA
jgi:hypothetical protein